MTPTGLAGEAIDKFTEYAPSQIVGLVKGISGCGAINCNHYCPLLYFTATLITWKVASSVCILKTLSMPSLFVWPPGCAKNLLIEFFRKNFQENTAFLEEFLFPESLFFTQCPSCQCLESCCSGRAVAKQCLAFFDFWDGKFSISAKFWLKLLSYLEPTL